MHNICTKISTGWNT